MCRIDLQGTTGQGVPLVAPLAQLAFNRRHPIAQDLAAYRERPTEKAAVNRLEAR